MLLVTIFATLAVQEFLEVETLPNNTRLHYSREFGYSNFGFWHWDHGFLDERRKCRNITSVQVRITGGNIAEPNMFAYQAALLMLQAPKIIQCGGALISQRFVLTAAHCLQSSSLGKVFLGTNKFADPNSAAAVYNVTYRDFSIYAEYSPYSSLHDIGTIYLKKAAPISKAVEPVMLARSFMTQSFLEGETVTTSGWGRTSDTDNASEPLLYFADVPVMNQRQCECFYLPGLVRSQNHICTDGAGGKGSCDGDSGGPLTYFHRGTNYLVGLTSFGSAAGCEINAPSVYTRITAYLGWISRKTGININ